VSSTGIVVTWIVLYVAATIGLKEYDGLSHGARLFVAFAPTPVFALFVWRFIAEVRRLDELGRRIHLEALALAYSVGMLLLTTLGLVQRAVTLDFQDWSYSHVWTLLAILYTVGLRIARKRYNR
jgi:hypothetical protein